MRLPIQRLALLLSAVFTVFVTPSAARAQKALVYCPVNVDATGCNAIVAALGPSYALGVDRGYDGTGGTVDLKTVDLFAYSVFVVPSLADGPTSQPYAKLRDPEVVEHLKAALIGRIAMWSGSPDQGATNRAAKDALMQNLAGWASGAFGAAKGPGLVALLDASATASSRYDWVRAITPLPVSSDPALLIYNNVRALNPRGTAILMSGAGPIVYDNMATFGFQVPNGAAGVSLDAVGQTGTAQGGQVVLVTMEAGNSSGALVQTNTDDYPPGTPVIITGSGWAPGETVKLTLHMDPLREADTELTAIADGSGNLTNSEFAPSSYDVYVRFVLTAVGQSSGRRSQTTFTDAPRINTVTVGSQVGTPTYGTTGSATFNVTSARLGNGTVNGTYSVTLGLPAGVTASFAPATFTSNGGNPFPSSILTLTTSATVAPGAYVFTVRLADGPDQATNTGTLTVSAKSLSGSFTGANKPYDGTIGATILTRSLTGVVGSDVVSLAGGTATFNNKNVGASKTVTGSGFSLTGADAANYTLASGTLTTTANITPKTLTVTGTGTNKTYDGTTAATVTLADDRILGDVFTASFTSATFADKNVGTAKAITVNGIAIAGTDAANYTANTTCTTAADITAKPLTGTFTADNKVYDGNTSTTIAARNLAGMIVGDAVNLTGGTATFDTKNVGNAKTVTGTGFSLAGTDAPNYTLASSSLTTTANVTARALTVTAAGVNKTYDGTTAAAVTLADDKIAGDAVTPTYTSATFGDKNVGTAKPVSVNGISLGGADAGNYTFNATAVTTADIAPRALAVSATGQNKVYDGNASAAVTLSDDRVSGDLVTTAFTTAAFDNKNVGSGKTVSVSGISVAGADAGNYTFNSTATTTANITVRTLVVTATGVNKVYDGTVVATVTLADDRVAGDVFTANYASASFADKNVGTAKPVLVSSIALSGADAGNYAQNSTASTTADITARALVVGATGMNKVYDATTAATVTLADNRVVGDVFTDSYVSASFADKNVGTSKPISVAGITITGIDATNYTFNTTAGATANITVATVTGSFTADDKGYDGTTEATISNRSLAGGLLTDVVSLTDGTATFADKNVGTGKTVTGTGFTLGGGDAGNYVLASTTLTTTANVTARALTVTATGANKVYDATTAAAVTLADDRVAGDVFTNSYASAAFADKNVGAAKPVSVSGISISGSDAANYTANTTASATADITVATVTGTITAGSKVYDATTAATIATRALTGVLLADNVSLTGGTATFSDENVGNGKTVTANSFTLAGADAPNYSLSPTAVTTTADITQKSVTGSFTADNKVYDGTTAATISNRSLAGTIGGDDITLSGGTATFADKNVGAAKAVSGVGFALSGADAPNYSLISSSLTTTADITPRAITVTADPQTKVYGTVDPTLTYQVTNGTVVAGDAFTGALGRVAGETVLGSPYAIQQNGLTLGTNYALTYVGANLTITAATVAGLFTASNKVYDGTDAASIGTRSLTSGVVGSDDVALTGGSATFSDKNAGTGKTVTGTGFTLGGTTASNYVLASTTLTTTADITPRALLVGAAGINKVYDATTGAAVNLSDDRVSGDVLATAYTAAAFDNKNVGTAKPVNITGITISGTDAGNYTQNPTAATTADITVATLTGSFTADNKVYDGNTGATIATRSLAGVLLGDAVTLDGGIATFSDKNVGNGKTVTGAGFGLVGGDAPNYVLASTTLTTTANITARALTVTAAGINKIYDGTAVATVTLADNRVSGDVFSDTYGSAAFDTKNAGTGKPISVSGIAIAGADAGNYTFNATASTTADIAPRALAVSATGTNKVYDGTTAATVTLADDRVAGDLLTTAYTAAAFDNKNAGTAKVVSVTGISVSGVDAGNYSFNTSATTTADITKRALAVAAAGINKIYDGTATATVTLADDRVSGDVFIASYAAANFSDKNVGSGKTVSASGISLSGADAGNYSFNTTTSTTADITPRALLVTATGVNRVYDATTAATVTLADDRVAGDVFTDSYSSAAFADKNVGAAKPVSVNGITITGTDASNYTFNTIASTTANITVATLAGSFSASSKVYDGNATATIASRNVAGVILTDGVTMIGGAATFSDENVGTGKTVNGSGFTLSGADAANYVLASTTLTTTADITARALTVSATGIDRIYDGTTAATVTLADDRVSGDDISTTYAAATFSDKNVGLGKSVSVSGIALGGGDAGNYTFNTSTSTTADITPRALAVSATGQNKVYDGNATATVTLSDDRVSGDVLSTAFTTAAFDNKNVGNGKTVSVSGISVAGADAGNYAANTTASTTADITARALAVTAAGINKVYDGNTTATVTLSDDRVAGDVFTDSYTSATFNNANVGTVKPISVTGIAITGTDAANYTFNVTAATTADITPRPITITAAAKTKVYGDVDPALTYSLTVGTLVAPGDLTGALTRVAGQDVGTYAIQQGTLALTTNYALTYLGANLTITPHTLTVTADDKSKIAGAVNPPLTGVIAGIQFSDNITATYSTTAVTLSLPGTYPITPAFVDPTGKLGNYTVTINGGTLTVAANAKPVLGAITAPLLPTALGTPVTVSAPFTDIDVPASQPYTTTIDWGNGTTTTNSVTSPGTISGTKTYPAPGVYTVTVTVKQDNFPATHFDTKTFEYYVVVYDPNGGFVTGGGWINSPAGAYYANPSLTGKANFGFVAKYKKGQSAPDGNTEFQYQTGNLNFKATSFDWLVIAGSKAQFKGSGTVNGSGDYGFMLTATDGTLKGNGSDTFRMKIWIKATGAIVYDNLLNAPDSTDPTTTLGGGSIEVHDK